MILGDAIMLGGTGGETASIFVTGLTSADHVVATKGSKTWNGVWTERQTPNPAYRGLPSGYTQVEYIQSSGTQWIDTGITAKYDSTKVEISNFAFTSFTEWFGAFGVCDEDGKATTFWLRWLKDNSTIGSAVGTISSGTPYTNWSYSYSVGTVLNKVVFDRANGLYVNDVQATRRLSDSTVANSTYNMYMFAINQQGTAWRTSSAKMGGVKIYENNTLVRDFVPCKNSSDVYGMYDLVSNAFFSNGGTGTFTAGNEIPQYIVKQGHLISSLNEYGTYTVTATDGTQTVTQDVLVDVATEYEISMGYSLFTYLKWSITKLKTATKNIQMSEFKMLDADNNYLSWDGATITATKPHEYSGEEIDKIIDNNVETKYCAVWSSTAVQTGLDDIVIYISSGIDISRYNRYQYYTANDGAFRDPISWTLSVSNDGTIWRQVDSQNDLTITTTRKALAGTWNITI